MSPRRTARSARMCNVGAGTPRRSYHNRCSQSQHRSNTSSLCLCAWARAVPWCAITAGALVLPPSLLLVFATCTKIFIKNSPSRVKAVKRCTRFLLYPYLCSKGFRGNFRNFCGKRRRQNPWSTPLTHTRALLAASIRGTVLFLVGN